MYDASRDELEFEIYFHNVKESYMIIKYKDGVSFQRCGDTDGVTSIITDKEFLFKEPGYSYDENE